jgi:predicted kinase
MKVIILRGISGSGKSTWIKNHHPDATIASADDAFRMPDGTYDFSDHANRIHDAHKRCFQTFLQAMRASKPMIIVDNGNIHTWEIAPYLMPAQSFGYEVEILTLECDPKIAIQRKNWNTPEQVRSTADKLISEERQFPAFMQKIHRKLQQDAL